MNRKLIREHTEEKENMRKMLVNSRMTEICYAETFSLIFKQRIGDWCNEIEFALMIDAPCWFGNKDEWKLKLSESDVVGYGDSCLASELVRLRYSNYICVVAVDFFDEYFQIVFNNGDKLSIAYYSQSEYSWVLEEICEKREMDRISIFCQGNEMFQNNISEFLGILQKYNL